MRRFFLLLLLILPLQVTARSTDSARDLAQIRASGELRVLINQSEQSSGVIGNQRVGAELQRLEAFLGYLNNRSRSTPVRLKLLPRAGDDLYDSLRRGEGDLVVSSELLGPIPSRMIVASEPIAAQVPLVVVARQGNRQYANERGLTGRFFSLPNGSAAEPALHALSKRLQEQGLAPVDYEVLDRSLAVEDVLELIQSGSVLLTVMEQPIAERWVALYPRLRIDRHLVLANDGVHAWYMHRKAANLKAKLASFWRDYQPPRSHSQSLQQAYQNRYRLQNPLGNVEVARLRRVRGVLEEKAQAHQLDWRLLAAIGFKESTLNPQARGSGGAIGLMQVTPATARAQGINDARTLANNVEASARYLVRLRDRFFSSEEIDPVEQQAFMLAAYNMGPQRVQALREHARQRGLDPNRWYFNVERIVLEERGIRGANYVNALNKYYLIYQREGESLAR